ncbi:anti-sigma-D factor RsdA [Amycolatopsis antarctica]|uniref:anti-sigma-D factor RsdA n=1 Tax=Amycolatopsis antarctica TaxID=1854586 RepID=UPI001F0A4D9E|nr:anti-sigma-D factor RsdA [Amycolatopsis antarctica]
MNARQDFEDHGAGEPVPDLSVIQADDALLDALGGSDPKVADGLGDQELNALLLAWRRDIDSEPLAELVDTDTALVTIKTATMAKRHGGKERKRRMLVPVAAAAAVLAIAFTGTGIAARDAQPGDTLWGLTKVLYADQARSTEAAVSVRTDLEAAQLALAQGKFDEARQALDDAQLAMSRVGSEDDLAGLQAQHLALYQQLAPVSSPQNPPSNAPQPTSASQPGQSGGQPQPTQPTSPPVDTRPSNSNPDPGQTLPDTSSNPPDTSSSTTPPPTSSSTPTSDEGSEPGTGTSERSESSNGVAPMQAPAGVGG